jgi:hypothetical protein
MERRQKKKHIGNKEITMCGGSCLYPNYEGGHRKKDHGPKPPGAKT